MHDIIKNKKVSFKVINKVINQRRVTSKFLPRDSYYFFFFLFFFSIVKQKNLQ